MIKKLVLLVIVSWSGIANAQYASSGITLFGRLDTGIVNQTNRSPGGTVQAMNSSVWLPSLWGISGREDLGGGWSTIFNMASTIVVNSGSQASQQKLFDRNAFVGVTSNKWGSLTFGRQVNTLADTFYVVDPLGARAAATNMNVRFGYLGGPGTVIQNNFGPNPGVSGASLDRVDNAAKYVFKAGNGLSGGALYAFGGAPGNFSANSAYGFLLGYDGTALSVRGSYMQYKDATGIPFRAVAGGVSYKIGTLTLKASYTENKIESGLSTSVQAYRNMKTQVYAAGADWFVTPTSELVVAYYHGKRTQDGLPDQVADKFYLVPTYLLSKRTSVQLVSIYERFNASGSALDTGTPLATGARSSVYLGLGITHDF
ncbi:Porin [Paraburkholderia unamae]|uniref:porin n=1 Tax=Paraburkholderia unamae TaxID=219649 RepID=UPI001CAF5F2B|nr:porin [Paraburkholderia unamae]CAG9246075.1 Porin [Paraburkholderia unamae]